MWTYASLEHYMRDLPDGKIIANQIMDVGFFRALSENFEPRDYAGNNIIHLLKIGRGLRGTAHAPSADMPVGATPSFKELKIPLAQLIVNASLESQALDRAEGMPGSWGKPVDDAIKDMMVDFEYLKCISALGNGKGLLARCGNGSTGDPSSNNGSVTTVKVDNSYTDFFWDNCHMLREGMLVDIYASDQTTLRVANVEITSVTMGKRNNAAIGATYGTFTFAAASDYSIVDGDLVYLHGTQSKIAATNGSEGVAPARSLPMGMAYMAQNGLAFESGNMQETLAYGLARATYGALRARLYGAADDAGAGVLGFGLDTESPAYGTPTYWDVSVWDDMILDILHGSGQGKVNTIITTSRVARSAARRSQQRFNFTVMIDNVRKQGTTVVGTRIPDTFIGPGGEEIKLITEEFFPNNCVLMFDSDNMAMHQPHGGFDYTRLFGNVWGPVKGNDRTDNIEAPYKGYLQFSAERFDNIAFGMDFRDNC